MKKLILQMEFESGGNIEWHREKKKKNASIAELSRRLSRYPTMHSRRTMRLSAYLINAPLARTKRRSQHWSDDRFPIDLEYSSLASVSGRLVSSRSSSWTWRIADSDPIVMIRWFDLAEWRTVAAKKNWPSGLLPSRPTSKSGVYWLFPPNPRQIYQTLIDWLIITCQTRKQIKMQSIYIAQLMSPQQAPSWQLKPPNAASPDHPELINMR